MRASARAVLLGLLFTSLPVVGWADPPESTAPSHPPLQAVPQVSVQHLYTLKECLALARRNYPEVAEARARLHDKQAELWEAHTEPFSDFDVTAGLGLAPTVRGTSVYSPNTDVALTSNMALAWQVGIEGAIPLWTFGKISNLWDAAEAQVHVGEHEVKKEQNAVELSVKKAYYGVELARDSLDLVDDATKRIDKYIRRMQKDVAEGEGDDVQLLKMRMYREELDARQSEAAREERIAFAGLRFLTGVRGDMDIPDVPLRRSRQTLAPLARYLEAARLFRPEVNMARAGIVAREAQVRLEQSRYYPDLALALTAKWSRAPEVTDQINPFVLDNANYLHYGFALVLKWKLDFLPQSARLAEARAKLEEMRATERYALGGVGEQVEEAFARAKDAERRLDDYSRATEYARQWLIKVQEGIDVGTYDDNDIVDPAKQYALERFAKLNATYDYNVAIAELAQATGWNALDQE
jgi:outer membrane protein TolC